MVKGVWSTSKLVQERAGGITAGQCPRGRVTPVGGASSLITGLICRCPLVRIATAKGVGSADVHSVGGLPGCLCNLPKSLQAV